MKCSQRLVTAGAWVGCLGQVAEVAEVAEVAWKAALQDFVAWLSHCGYMATAWSAFVFGTTGMVHRTWTWHSKPVDVARQERRSTSGWC